MSPDQMKANYSNDSDQGFQQDLNQLASFNSINEVNADD